MVEGHRLLLKALGLPEEALQTSGWIFRAPTTPRLVCAPGEEPGPGEMKALAPGDRQEIVESGAPPGPLWFRLAHVPPGVLLENNIQLPAYKNIFSFTLWHNVCFSLALKTKMPKIKSIGLLSKFLKVKLIY